MARFLTHRTFWHIFFPGRHVWLRLYLWLPFIALHSIYNRVSSGVIGLAARIKQGVSRLIVCYRAQERG